MKEFDYIQWIRSRAGVFPDRPDILVGPGDDCAVMRFEGELLVTTDQCLDGVHFRLERCGPRAAGRKIFARSLSDLAAMGARPVAAVATAALPASVPAEAMDDFQRELHAGLTDLAERFDCPIVGGDLSFKAPVLHLTVTAFGRAPDGGAVLRSTARPGDRILVTGQLGGAWRCGRDLGFTPRLAEAAALVERFRPTAMIDLSDGLAGDLGHLCAESGVGARIESERLPVSTDALQTTHPLAAALGDGEDYELLFTAAPAVAARLLKERPFDTPVRIIGEITDSPDHVDVVGPDGRAWPLSEVARGWEHGSTAP